MTHEEGRLTDIRKAPRTTCKICWCSIYNEDETIWVISPAPGLAHKVCVRPAQPPPSP